MIQYGFFDAEEFEEKVIDEQTVLVPDRAYSPSDMNNYFEGIISSNGAFYTTNGAFFVRVLPDSAITPEEAAQHPNAFKVIIQKGVGRINNHFVKIPDNEIIFIDHGSADGNRWDRIVLRLDVSERTITPTVLKGAVVDPGLGSSTSLNNCDPKYCIWSASSHEEDIWDIGIAEIGIPMNASQSGDIPQNLIKQTTGTDHCPWITNIIEKANGQNAVEANLQEWLRKYANYFKTWFDDVVDDLELSTNISPFYKIITGGGITQWVLEDLFANEGYKFNPGDIFDVFYNGLKLMKDQEFVVTNEGQLYLSARQTMSGDNTLYIQILKSQVGLPTYVDGDDIPY